MVICPTCKSGNPAAAEVCGGCGRRLAGPPGSGAPATVVTRPKLSAADSTEQGANLTVRTPPPASLPAPMIEPIAPVVAGTPAPAKPPAGSALTRGLSQLAPELLSGPAPSSVALWDSTRGAGSAPPTVHGTLAAPSESGSVEAPAPTLASAEPRLVVVRGERLNVAYPVLEGRNYIGRCADRPVDIDLDGQEPIERIWTSRQHAVITWDRGVMVIEDLNSLNGTFVNRARIHPGQRQVLQAGDVVQIGTVQLRVLL